VIGVTLKLWDDAATDGTKSCCSPQAVTVARGLAHRMGIPHLTLDVRDGFRGAVVDDFVAEHAAGRTPNPCVRCNGLVRFDRMLDLATSLGAARLATGHYARITRDDEGPLVSAAADANKDQSYMLARLDPALLDRLWFPLAELDKPSVRKLAAAAKLAVAEKPESQDLCFLAGIDAHSLLQRRGVKDNPGDIVDMDGAKLGTHEGHQHFTIGQRRGLGVSSTEPLYLIDKDPTTNTITVGPKEALKTRTVHLTDVILHRPAHRVTHVKLRYRSEPVEATVDCRLSTVDLAVAFEAATPGQTAVFLENGTVLGCATISEPSHTVPVSLPLAAPAHV
jgi:tRNA-specific 2-thiouridylase